MVYFLDGNGKLVAVGSSESPTGASQVPSAVFDDDLEAKLTLLIAFKTSMCGVVLCEVTYALAQNVFKGRYAYNASNVQPHKEKASL